MSMQTFRQSLDPDVKERSLNHAYIFSILQIFPN